MAKKILSILVEEKTTLVVHMDYGASTQNIYQCLRIATPENTVEDGMIKNALILGQRINEVCRKNKIHTNDVIFTLASSKIANRIITIPFVPKNKVFSLLKATVSEHFPVDIDKYSFAFPGKGTEKNAGDERTLDFLVFAAPNQIIKSYYALAEAMKVNIVALDCEGNSVYQLMKRQVEDKVVMSVQINRLGTLVNIIDKDELLLQRALPYGIGMLTDAMIEDKSFQVNNFAEAYKLLATRKVLWHNFEQVGQDADASSKKRAEVTESLSYLISNINRMVEYYNTKFKDKPIREVVCTGTGAGVVGINELMNQTLNLQTSIPTGFKGIKVSKKISETTQLLQFVACFGAAFDPVSFVTQESIQKEENRSSAFGTMVVFFASLVLCAAMCVTSFIQLADVKDKEGELMAEEARMQPIEARFNQLTEIVNEYNLYQTIDRRIKTPSNSLHSILTEIAKISPKNFKINSVTTSGVTVTMSAVTTDRLSSISALKMKLNTMGSRITNIGIGSIAESKDQVTKRRQYTFSIVFDLVRPVSEEVPANE